MMLELLSANEAPPSEELRPIRHGAMAIQPQPDPAGRVYVGLAAILPADIRNLCSCAGFFYARVIRTLSCDLVQVIVCAQPRYFDADVQSRARHLRPHYLSEQQLDQLLEWDRSLAGMATCDVQDMLAFHTKQVLREQQQHDSAPTLDTQTQQLSACPKAVSEPATPQKPPCPVYDRAGVIDVDLASFVPEGGVIIPIDAVRDLAFPQASSRSSLPRLLLRATLRQLRVQRLAEKRWAERRVMKEKELRIRRMYQQRDHLPLHKLIEITPIYGCGKQRDGIVACRVEIDLPAA
jgi:hypothetical protein